MTCKNAIRGFTLIEIMIVLVIIGMVLAVAVPKLANSKSKIKDEVKHIAIIAKEVHNVARLENRTYRIVFNMDEKKQRSYWVESAAANATLLSADQSKKLKDETDPKKNLIAKNNGFEVSHSILKDAVKLPKELFIDSIEFSDGKTVAGEQASIHFFAQGLVQEAAIHLSDHKTLVWTIYISPLTAHTIVFERNESLKEISQR